MKPQIRFATADMSICALTENPQIDIGPAIKRKFRFVTKHGPSSCGCEESEKGRPHNPELRGGFLFDHRNASV